MVRAVAHVMCFCSQHTRKNLQLHLETLSCEIGPRPVGSAANRRAESYIAAQLERLGYTVRRQQFECEDWRLENVDVEVDGVHMPVRPNNYSRACDVRAPLVTAHTIEDLKSQDLRGRVVALHGGLSADPWQPRHFRFFSIRDQLHLREHLERAQPAAVITISPRNEHVRPIIEDGEFHIPSVTVSASVGAQLLAAEGHAVRVCVDSCSQPAMGANVIADGPVHLRGAAPQVLLCAHYDTKHESPGALDNASGVAAMMALADRLARRRDVEVQCLALNGHDHFAAPGQQAYQEFLGATRASLDLVVNFDDIGYETAANTVAFMGCSERFVTQAREYVAHHGAGLLEIGPWPQGDHAAFWYAGVPSVAFTSEASFALPDRITHTPLDVAANVNVDSICDVVAFVEEALIDGLAVLPARRIQQS